MLALLLQPLEMACRCSGSTLLYCNLECGGGRDPSMALEQWTSGASCGRLSSWPAGMAISTGPPASAKCQAACTAMASLIRHGYRGLCSVALK